jgi:hypothetical protein
MTWLFVLKKALPYLIVGAIAAAGAWYIQSVRIGAVKNDLRQQAIDLKVCTDANAVSKTTIEDLRDEIAAANGIANARLSDKDTAVKRIRAIDALQPPTKEATREKSPGVTAQPTMENVRQTDGNAGPGDRADDPILRELNRMFDGGSGGSED